MSFLITLLQLQQMKDATHAYGSLQHNKIYNLSTLVLEQCKENGYVYTYLLNILSGEEVYKMSIDKVKNS